MTAETGAFPCEDYLKSEYASAGHWDEAAQIWMLVPKSAVEVIEEQSFMAVGRPGVDGVLFGYRRDHSGFWAYHPIPKEFQWLAADIHGFVEGWQDGTITV